MLRGVHQRYSKSARKTIFSKLVIPLPNCPDIYGHELPEGNNEHDISCIPAGLYTCTPYFSPSRQEKCWLLQGENLGDRKFIEIHAGNFACEVVLGGKSYTKSTDGCLIYGLSLDEAVPMICRSKSAMQWLHDNIGLETTWELEIKDI